MTDDRVDITMTLTPRQVGEMYRMVEEGAPSVTLRSDDGRILLHIVFRRSPDEGASERVAALLTELGRGQA